MTEAEKLFIADKAIAEFMGYYYQAGKFYSGKHQRGNWFKTPKYSYDWNWLMRVGKKIFDYLQSEIKKRPQHNCTQGDLLEVNITCAIREYDIVKAHEYIYEWVKWYNTQSINKPASANKKYPIGFYAPGNYSCHCSSCGKSFQGDKRAVQCEPCAVADKEKFDALSPEEQEELMKRNAEIINSTIEKFSKP